MKRIEEIIIIILTIITQSISAQDFNYEGLNYVVISGNRCAVVLCEDCNGDIVIPSTVSDGDKEYTVTEIGTYAFGGSNITSVTFPESLEAIGAYAFSGCKGLTLVNFPESLKYIDAYAFERCTNLTTVNFPSSRLESIGTGAFEGCISLTSIDLWAWWVEMCAFKDCKSLTSVFLLADRMDYEAFMNCTSLNHVYLDYLRSLGVGVFMNCTNLTSLDFPTSLNSIEQSAFEGCISLTSLDFPTSLESIGQSAFEGCTGLTSLDFPASLKSIGQGAFKGCTNLTSLDFPTSLNSIEQSAFEGCTGLTSLDFPASLKSIGQGAFKGCTNLTSLDFPTTSLKSIGQSAFEGCTGLTSLDFPASLESIGQSAFEGCTGLTSLDFPTSLALIGEWAFKGCTGLTSLDFPTSLKSIGQSAFEGCTGLTVLDFRGPHTSSISPPYIDISAFKNCYYLTSITFGTAVNINDKAFSGCERITSIVWQEKSKIHNSIYKAIENPNLLVYVYDVQYAPDGLDRNIVVMDVESGEAQCERLILEQGYSFYPLYPFTSYSSSMTKKFTQVTPIDGCAGWDTIVLPFDVTSVQSARGELTPFAMLTDIGTQHPYWLYEPDREGEWKAATAICAGVPYIISMPNNEKYQPSYCINGAVVFSTDEPVFITSAITRPYSITWSSGNKFHSLWLSLDEKEAEIAMGLNVDIDNLTDSEGTLLQPGSAFHVGVRPKPLEAYVTSTAGGVRALPVRGGELSHEILISAVTDFDVIAADGKLSLVSAVERTVEIYRIDGVRIATVRLCGGEYYVVEGLDKGLYIVAGRKVIIK